MFVAGRTNLLAEEGGCRRLDRAAGKAHSFQITSFPLKNSHSNNEYKFASEACLNQALNGDFILIRTQQVFQSRELKVLIIPLPPYRNCLKVSESELRSRPCGRGKTNTQGGTPRPTETPPPPSFVLVPRPQRSIPRTRGYHKPRFKPM